MIFDPSFGAGLQAALVVCLLAACAFEFVNGFHDTANAVATVIYTHSLRPWAAVLWSGFCNFLGVLLGGIAVATAIINLLPVELLVASGSNAGMAMALALLLAAIIWNLGTWYFGLPASSSHTMIGAILGAGLANSALPGHRFGSGVNWSKAAEVGLSLLVSPLVGFGLAYLLLRLAKRYLSNPALYRTPRGVDTPPWWIRGILIGTCTGVSFAHGSNDGQKGVGLIMLILIGLLPGRFAVNNGATPPEFDRAVRAVERLKEPASRLSAPARSEVRAELAELELTLASSGTAANIPATSRFHVRRDVLLVENRLKDDAAAKPDLAALRRLTDYSPTWVLIMVAVSLGLGTTVGWERIVKTVGEKIGKDHLTYAQGAAAELVAMSTVGIAAISGLPVSTTHVLSSGIAGAMVSQGSGIRKETVTKIAMAWILTLPASMLLSGCLYLLFRWLLGCAGCELGAA